MVGNTYQVTELQIFNTGFFFDLTESCDTDILTGLLMTFRKIPEAVTANHQKITTTIAGQASGSIDLLELTANNPVTLLHRIGRNVDTLESCRSLEHLHQRTDVVPVGKMKLDSIGVCQCCFLRSTYYNGPAVKIYLVHIPQTYKKERTR